jgi:hypothetical protein
MANRQTVLEAGGGFMHEIFVAALIFVCLVGASLGTLLTYGKLAPHHRQEDTNTTVRLVANIFVVMTSLVLGLMINSAKNTFEAIDHNVHAYATALILFDRTAREIGPAANDVHEGLITYVRRAVNVDETTEDPLVRGDRTSEAMLESVGKSLNAIKPADDQQAALWDDARQQFRKIVEQRWVLVEQSEGSIPPLLIVMLVAWLILIFASFGYRAPRNMVIVTMFVLSAFLISASLYLILDLDVPFSGPIQVSDAPMRRALAEFQQ